MNYIKSQIVENTEISPSIYKMVVKVAKENSEKVKPGQFYMLRGEYIEPLLPRPISLCEVKNDELTFIYAVLGRGTKLFSNMKPKENIMVWGPLGNGFNVEEGKGKVAIVAGGIGIAPMLELTKAMKQENKDTKIDVYAGFRDEHYLLDEINIYVDDVHISTDTGKYGHKGFVTDILNIKDYDIVYCCGPEPMMNKVIKMGREADVKIYVSTEKHMACGVGACLVCTCKTKDGNKRSCKDGPVFLGTDLIIE